MIPSRTLKLFFSSSDLHFIPIQQNAGRGVDFKLVAFLEGAPAIVVGFRVQSDLILGGFGQIVQQDKVGGFVELL